MGWQDISWPLKKGDPGRPIILGLIGHHILEAVCDLSAAVNIIPMSVCDNVLRLALLLKTNMRIRFVDRSTHHIEGIADDIKVLAGDSHVASNFTMLNTGRNKMTPIILG